jgi:HEAT repeat protein
MARRTSYPFEAKFVKAVEKAEFPTSLWRYLLERTDIDNEGLVREFANAGYTLSSLSEHIKAINEMDAGQLLEHALHIPSVREAACCALQIRTTRDVVDLAIPLLRSVSSLERELGVRMLTYNLGQTFLSESSNALRAMLPHENDDRVLEALCYAMYHLDIEQRVSLLHHLVDNKDAQVRTALAFSFFGMEDPIAVKVAITLSNDQVAEVRHWATAGLRWIAHVNRDNLQTVSYLTEVFWGRLTDSDKRTSLEALVALSTFKDNTVLDRLIMELSSDEVWNLTLEAAVAMENPALYPYLLELERKNGTDYFLQEALEACKPK